ncbi:MAG TPA: DNRLRE domain-containing protein [Firmicutes bacterium]|nr:DNRLRE domain-containing protein [Bacillota bacterium]
MNVMTTASLAITGALLAMLNITSIPYTVELSPATIAYQQAGIAGVSSVTQSPYEPVVNPYRTTGSPIILGGGGTRVYLQPELPEAVVRLPEYAIVSAELIIPLAQQAASSTSGTASFGSYQITGSWSQSNGTYFSAPPTSTSPFAFGSQFYDAQSAGSSGFMQTLSFDVTWLVRAWVSGAPNYGIMIQELNPAQTGSLWWQAPLGAEPELIITVHRDYLSGGASPGDVSYTPLETAPDKVVIRVHPTQTGLSLGAGAYTKAVTVQTGALPAESFKAYGMQGEFELKVDRLEMRLAGGIGVATDITDPNRTLPPTEGVVGEFTLLGSLAFAMGDSVTMLPGIGLFVDAHSLTFGSYLDRIEHSRTLGSLVLSNEWRFAPAENTFFSAHIALSPVGAIRESFKSAIGAGWVKQETGDIYATWIEGRLNAKLQLLPHTQLTAGYATSAAFVPTQRIEVIYTDSNGNYVSGTDVIERTVINTGRAYVGFAYFF